MDDAYRPIVDGVQQRSMRCYFQREDQLVISRQAGAPLPYSGNSFWISRQGDEWYLCTWVPRCYRVPASADLLELCEEFVECGHSAQYVVPADLVQRYALEELTPEEADRRFG